MDARFERQSLEATRRVLTDTPVPAESVGVKGSYIGGPLTVDDGPAIQQLLDRQKAIVQAGEGPGVVTLRGGVYVLQTPITIDAGYVALQGYGGVTLLSNVVGQPALVITSTRPAEEQYLNGSRWIGGFELRGLSLAGSIGLEVGKASDIAAGSQVHIRDFSVRRFATNLRFAENAYRIHFDHYASFDALANGRHIDWPAGISANAGEVIHFSHAMFANSQGATTDAEIAELYFADLCQVDFHACSLLNCRLNLNAEVDAYWTGGNLENPGTSFGYRMIRVGPTARFYASGARLTLNATGGSNTVSPFESVANSRGFIADGFRFPGGSLLNFGGATGIRELVTGEGPVSIRHGIPFGSPSSWPGQQFPLLSSQQSVVTNGTFETAALTPWGAVTAGTGGSATVNGTAALRGSQGCQITLTGGGAGSVQIGQNISVTPGQLCQFHLTYRVVSGTPTVAHFVRFLGATGITLGTLSSSALTATARTESVIVGLVPPGAMTADVVVEGATASGAGTIYVDDALVNLS